MTQNLDGEIRKIIAEVFEIPEAGIQEDVNFYETYNIDSLRIIEVFVELERKLSLRIPPSDVEGVETFASLLELIERYIPETLAVA